MISTKENGEGLKHIRRYDQGKTCGWIEEAEAR